MKKNIFFSCMMLGVFSIGSANAEGPSEVTANNNTVPHLTFNEEISLIETEEEIDLGFDPYLYLPEDFNPYEGMVLPVTDIVVYDIEEEITLDFDTTPYLPKDFNPYKGM